MAEIQIERKPRGRGGWAWALVIVVLVVLAAAAWYFLAGPGARRVAPGPEIRQIDPDVGGVTTASPGPGAADATAV